MGCWARPCYSRGMSYGFAPGLKGSLVMSLSVGAILLVALPQKAGESLADSIPGAVGGAIGVAIACALMNWWEARARARNRP